MKSFLIFTSGMFAGAFFLILFLFLYNATNPSYHDCMMDWGNLPDHGCEDRWDAPKEIKDSNKIDSNDWDVDVLDDSISVSIDGNISAGDKYRVLLSSKGDNPCEVATQVTSFYSVTNNSEKKFNMFVWFQIISLMVVIGGSISIFSIIAEPKGIIDDAGSNLIFEFRNINVTSHEISEHIDNINEDKIKIPL